MSLKLLKANICNRVFNLFRMKQIRGIKYNFWISSMPGVDNSSKICSRHILPDLFWLDNLKNTRRTFCQNQMISTCWNCRKDSGTSTERDIFFCFHCGSLRHINQKYDYFTLFGQENRFSLDTNELTTKFRQLQSVLHPDKFSKKTKLEQTLSADWSSLINKAYKTLSTPIDRAIYMLKQHNITIPEENTAVDKLFLVEMMERNEEVDDATSIPELDDLLLGVRSKLRDTIGQLDKCFATSKLDEAKSKVITMRYLISLENSIKEKKSKFVESF